MITTALSLRPFFTSRLTGIFMLNLDSDSHQHEAVRKRKFQLRREGSVATLKRVMEEAPERNWAARSHAARSNS